jgi:N,N'-diacetyllegionaminate synthase
MSVLIIAEAGVNHNGSLELAKKMAYVAKEAGADIVKYQTAVPELVISQYAPKAEYQRQTTGSKESQLDMVRKLHFGFDAHRELKEYCDSIGIKYLSTPFDLESIDFLADMDMPVWKIPSGEVTNLPYLEKVGKLHRPVIMSTGMCEKYEIKDALDILYSAGTTDVTVLHCNTEYPTPPQDANVRAMVDIANTFHTKVGYSDHTLGLEAPLAAVALGATVLEKHFTLDKNMPGPDHKASMDPYELKMLVRAVRKTEIILGDGVKRVTKSEEKNKAAARKSIVAKVAIKKGEIFTSDNITVKRPGTGVSPMRWYSVLGTAAVRDFAPDELIEL